MIVTVKVKTGCRSDSIVTSHIPGHYLVSVKARPIENKANKAIIKLLSIELKIPNTSISIKSGAKSDTKLFEY